MTEKASGACCARCSATWLLAAYGPAAPMGTLWGLDRAAGSAKAMATSAIAAVNRAMMPVARSAAGGRAVFGGRVVCGGGERGCCHGISLFIHC